MINFEYSLQRKFIGYLPLFIPDLFIDSLVVSDSFVVSGSLVVSDSFVVSVSLVAAVFVVGGDVVGVGVDTEYSASNP